jgi:hypothetical protein
MSLGIWSLYPTCLSIYDVCSGYVTGKDSKSDQLCLCFTFTVFPCFDQKLSRQPRPQFVEAMSEAPALQPSSLAPCLAFHCLSFPQAFGLIQCFPQACSGLLMEAIL